MALAATNDQSAGARCKRHDAAPVLFGRGASAPGAVRRLDCLNAKLAGARESLRHLPGSWPSRFQRDGFLAALRFLLL